MDSITLQIFSNPNYAVIFYDAMKIFIFWFLAVSKSKIKLSRKNEILSSLSNVLPKPWHKCERKEGGKGLFVHSKGRDDDEGFAGLFFSLSSSSEPTLHLIFQIASCKSITWAIKMSKSLFKNISSLFSVL